jgi:anaerobic magnesium-protoporphyrin IX monomethyl ester cyclase
MRVALLEPPATDPRSPHLAMASLHAALVDDDIDVAVFDAGADGLHWLLRPELVARSLAALEEASAGGGRGQRPGAEFLRRLGPSIVERIAGAVATLRDPERFYDAVACDEARELIGRALELHSAANGLHRYGIAPIRYDVAGINPARLADLQEVTARPEEGLFGPYYQELTERVIGHRPDIVAISILNHQQIIPGLTVARMLRASGHLVVIGGTVYAKFVEQLRARPGFFELFCDALCPYEGETALRTLCAEIADAQRAGRAIRFTGIPNLLWLDRATGRVEAGPVHVEDVEGLPTPIYDGFDLGSYLAPRPVLPILTGKGCYFNKCRFCDIPFINRVADRPYRRRRPETVAADIARLSARHGARHFVITDEALSPRFLLQLAEALADYPAVQPRLVGYARLEAGFTLSTCQRLYEGGLRRLFFGLESGSQRMLDNMQKAIKIPVAHEVIRNCAAAGISFHLFSMVGLPEETVADADQTLRFFLDAAEVIDHPRNTIDVHRFTLDLRTSYFDEAERFGIEVDRAALAEVDFPLDAPAWRATRGLSAAEMEAVTTRMSRRLQERFARSRPFPSHVYPSYEEYSVLYADCFDAADGDWSLRFALPDTGDPDLCELSWSEPLIVTPIVGGLLLSGVTGERRLNPSAFGLLYPAPAPAPVDELMENLVEAAGAPAGSTRHRRLVLELRAVVDDLLSVGLLRLQVSRVGGHVAGARP